jgi:hypothetical protein
MSGNKTTSGNGNLNRARIDAKPKEGARGTKDNSECASRRIGNLPKPSKVTTVDPEKNAGAAIAAARRQNISDGKSYAKGRNVIENTSDDSVLVADSGE